MASNHKQPAVYLLASKPHGTLYVGVTSNLVQRVGQHRNGLAEGFTKRYGVHMLVWFEQAGSMYAAITREKQLKKWRRIWKIALIERGNPNWDDLWPAISEQSATARLSRDTEAAPRI